MATASNYLILDSCSHIQTGDESSMTINVTIPGSHNTIYLVNPNCVNVGGHHNTVINQTDNSEVTEVEVGSCHGDADDHDDDYVVVSESEQERRASDTELVQREEGGYVADETTNSTQTQSLTLVADNNTTAFQDQRVEVGSPVEGRVQGTSRPRRFAWLLALFRPLFDDFDVVDSQGKRVKIGDNVWIKRRDKWSVCSAVYVGDGHVITQVKGEDKVRKVRVVHGEFYVVMIRGRVSMKFSRAEIVDRSENRLHMSYKDDEDFVADVFDCHTWDM